MNRPPKKTYLVTGGTGFIGAALVRRLVHLGHSVRCLDNHFRGGVDKLGDVAPLVEMVEADIRDSAAVRNATRGVDGVIHLAYVNGTEHFYSKPELVLDVAVRGMLSVLDACRSEGVKDLVLASSSEVYQTPPKVPTDETVGISIPDILNPRYSYGGGKAICELMAINYGRTGFDRVAVFRPHNVYGPNMGWEHVVPQFIQRALSQIAKCPSGAVPFEIQGDGRQTRSFIFIDDFTDGLMRVIENGQHLNVYHIGTRDEVSIRELAALLFQQLGREMTLVEGKSPEGATQRRCPEITKLEALGFVPQVSLADGISRTIQWYRDALSRVQ